MASIIRPVAQFIYNVWFTTNSWLVGQLNKRVHEAVGASLGMLSLEGHTLARAGIDTLYRYRKDPTEYGLDQVNPEEKRGFNPILLIHGAAGNWRYMGDMARSLVDKGYSVFVINLGGGGPTDEKRDAVHAKLDEIQALYRDRRPVDIVAHSMGANTALYSSFRAGSVTLQEGNMVQDPFRVQGADRRIRKVVNLANPTSAEEKALLDAAGKTRDVYNITASHDALMGHKTCALSPTHRDELSAGHIGIVYNPDVADAVDARLQPPRARL